MYAINDLVQIKSQYATAKFSGVYRIAALPGGNRKRHRLVNVQTGQKVDAYTMHFETYVGSADDAAAEKAMPQPGTVVSYRNAYYVITGATKYGARLALLGGGKEYTNVSVKSFTVIDTAKFTALLAG